MKKTYYKTTLACSLALMLGASTITLSACSSSTIEISDDDETKTDVIVYNWGEYIAEDTIEKFEAEYPQYTVVYREFETNETMYPNLSNTYDVIIPSDYMVCRLIKENALQELDYDKLSNVVEYMNPLFENVVYDQDDSVSSVVLDYAVPYMYCTVGLAYDANKIDLDAQEVDPEKVWGVLFDIQNANEIGMYDSMRESVGVALNYLGFSINSLEEEELSAAEELLINQKQTINPSYGVDNLKDKLASGELAAAETWSGDVQIIQERTEELGNEDEIDLQFALPEGSNWSTDMMCIPTNASNVEGALAFINFMYEPEIAYSNCEYVGYSTPNVEAQQMLPDEVKNNLCYYPDESTFSTLEIYFSNSDIEETYSDIWNTVKATS